MQPRSADKKSLSRRLRWLVIGTALIVAAIAGANAVVIAQLHQSTLHDVQTNMLRQSLTLSELVERSFQTVDLVLTSVAEKVRLVAASDGDLHGLSSQEYHAFLKEKQSVLPQIEGIGILDANGTRLNQTRDTPSPNRDLSSRQYFLALKDNPKLTSFIGDPRLGSLSGAWVIVMSRPIWADDGTFLGIVFAAMDMEYFEELFRSTSLGNGYAATLLRRDGVLLARYPRGGKIGAVIAASVLPTLAVSRSGVSRAVSPIDGELRIAAGYDLSNYPLVLIVTQNDAVAFAGWRATAITMSFIALMMIGIIIVAAWLIARSWKQQERLNAARADVVESEKVRALAEAELKRQSDLAEQSTRLTAAVENMTHGLCMFDKDKELVVCNDAFGKIYKLPPELRKPGTGFGDLLAYRYREGDLKWEQPNDALQMQLAVLARLSDQERSSRIDEHRDGRLIRVTRQPLPGGGWVATHEDITEQRRAEQELDETKRFLRLIIENIPFAVAVKDAKTRRFALVNRAFELMLDLTAEQLLGRTVFDIHKRKEAEFIDNADTQSLQNSTAVSYSEYEVQTRSFGSRIHATSRIVTYDGQGGPKFLIVVIEDVTERKKTEQRIAFMAHHDALTGLANRAAVAQRIEEAAARQRHWGSAFTVLLLDLDRFKHVNDTLGHSAGDALLREAATRLKTLLRETDVLARLGGDEFAIIQTGETEQQHAAAALLADRIIEIIGKPFDLDGNEVNIGTSIGIALAPEHGTNPDSLLKMADMALYSAKSGGRNGYRFFDPDMGAAADARHALENELRHAIQQNELELYYQPIIDSKTLRICSAEALIRWRHPTRGIVTPGNFIPLAEETGMITQIGAWVLRTACQDATLWPDHVKVAVNLSPVQFRKTNLSDVVMGALAQSGLEPTRLELEITETALIESAAECLPALRRFRKAGISVALDDFGTGYSSLSQLTMFPFDRIKIDKSFTQNLTKRSECAAIISATLTLAENLDIATTAEGVETKEQYQLLRLAGVTSLQGYFFKRPCPVGEIDFNAAFDAPPIADVA